VLIRKVSDFYTLRFVHKTVNMNYRKMKKVYLSNNRTIPNVTLLLMISLLLNSCKDSGVTAGGISSDTGYYWIDVVLVILIIAFLYLLKKIVDLLFEYFKLVIQQKMQSEKTQKSKFLVLKIVLALCIRIIITGLLLYLTTVDFGGDENTNIEEFITQPDEYEN